MENAKGETTGISTAAEGARAAPRVAGPFVHASGSRPLAGYTIKRGVGQGGFGEIYYALSDAGKEVALKLIRRNLEVELRGIRQCLNLKHPNLLDLYDIRVDDGGDTWVVMEYVADRCLEDILADCPAGLPPGEALAWFHGMAAGVAYLHDRGIVHRDLKPGNIFRDEGVVKIGDYGLSKFISCSRRSGHTESIGTVHYMAPEVANGRYGKEIDIYALGVILYEMLTGRVPFEGESVGEVLMKHLTARPDVSMLAEPYRSAIARALEKDPDRRFRSVGEMLAALPPSAGSQPGSAQRAAPSPPPAATVGVVQATVVDEEPIWRAVRESWQRLRATWDQANFSAPIKIALLLVGIVAFLSMAHVLIGGAVLLLITYGIYRVMRCVVLALAGPRRPRWVQRRGRGDCPDFRAPGDCPDFRAPGDCPDFRASENGTVPFSATLSPKAAEPLRKSAVPTLVVKPPRQRLTELVGSLLVGALVALAMCVVMILIGSRNLFPPNPEQYAWLSLVSIAATWAVLVPSKFWEGSAGEPMLRRFILMIVGIGLGLVAYFVAETLMVRLPPDHEIPAATHYQFPTNFYAAGDRRPLAMAYMAALGTLFVLLRWWRQTDPLRPTRLSLWSMFVSCFMAAVAAGIWSFPQPWLMMVAGTTSVAVQLASPWVPPRERLRPQRKTVI